MCRQGAFDKYLSIVILNKNMKQKAIIILLILASIIFVAGYIKLSQDRSKGAQNLSCNKKENCCVVNEDCKYIWFTGGCNTQEYVSKILKDAEEQGMKIGEAPLRENVTCTCENNKCVTHN